MRKISEEKFITQLHALKKKLGRTPTSREFSKSKETASIKAVTNQFGSWGKFLRAANLEPNRYSKKELVLQVKKLAKELRRTPTSGEFNNCPNTVSRSAIIKRFGSWNEFIRLAGLKPTRRKNYYDRNDLIAQVNGLAQELGKTPTRREFDASPTTVSSGLALKLFGSWNGLLRAANLRTNQEKP